MDKNFSFLDNYTYIKKDEIENKIEDIIVFLRNENLSEFIKESKELFALIKEIISAKTGIKNDEKLFYNLNEIFNLKYVADWHTLVAFLEKENCDLNDCARILQCFHKILFYFLQPKNDRYFFNSNFYLESSNNIFQERTNDNLSDNILKIEKRSVYEWLTIENEKLLIPIYQRKYTWDESKIQDLLEDIFARTRDKNQHYLGTIACKKAISYNNKNVIKIIDGQQRLTTSVILMCALRDLYKKLNGNWEFTIFNDIFNNPNRKYEFFEFIENSAGSDEENRNLLSLINGSENYESPQKSTVIKNYNKILEFMDKKNKEEILLFAEIYLHNFQLATIFFNKENFDNKSEMEIFENINSKGQKLTIDELAKNHIMNMCANNLLIDSAIHEINTNYAIKIGNKLKELEHKKKQETFYVNFAEFILKQELEKNDRFATIRKALNMTKDEISLSLFSNINEYINYLTLISDYLDIYISIKEKEQPKNKTFIKELDLELEKFTHKLHNKDTVFIYATFALHNYFKRNSFYFDDKKKTKRIVINIYEALRNYLLVSLICHGSGLSETKRTVMKIFNKIDPSVSLEEISKKIIHDLYHDQYFDLEILKNKLNQNIKENDQKTLLLLILENDLNENFNMYEALKQNITFEHILPTEWEEKWKKTFMDRYGSIDESRNKINDVIQKIGNGLLLTKTENSKIKNESFENKKLFYDKLFSSNASIYKNSSQQLDISQKEKWSIEDINQRTEYMASYLFSIFEKLKKDN